MSTVQATGPNLSALSPGFKGASSAASHLKLGDNDTTSFGAGNPKLNNSPAQQRLIPIIGPLLGIMAATLLLPFKALCFAKTCLIGCCSSIIALGILVGLMLRK